ncbi:hypothetical protein OAS39_13145 [Pirellulales bacterium]|nr:hypothetical protein [Pirellulales bacterium]
MSTHLRALGISIAFLAALNAAVAVETAIFNTSDSRFDAGVDNQGWWSDTRNANNSSDNYALGSTGRNFFTFDLGSLAGTVASATLELRRYSYTGNATETIEFFDVSTDAATLNNNTGTSVAIYDDLGTGTSYGQFEVSNIGSSFELLHFHLNAAAVADINGASGGFFSIGGSLTTNDGDDFVFGQSNGDGIQRLVVEVVPEPRSVTLATSLVLGLLVCHRRTKLHWRKP